MYSDINSYYKKSFEEVIDYLQKWIDGTVTYEDFSQFPQYDLIEGLNRYFPELSEEEWQEIDERIINVYHERIEKTFKASLRHKFSSSLRLRTRIEIAERDAKIYNSLINGDITEINKKRIEILFGIKDWDLFLKRLEDVLRGDFREIEDYISTERGYWEVDMLMNYKSFLHHFLRSEEVINFKMNPNSDLNKVKKGETNKPVHNRLTFGFRGDKESFKKICTLLNNKVGLLNEELNSVNDFVEVMTSKNLELADKKIYLNVYINQFRKMLDHMKIKFFARLQLSTLEKSQLFYSREGTLITATSLSANKDEYPEDWKLIEEIFKHN